MPYIKIIKLGSRSTDYCAGLPSLSEVVKLGYLRGTEWKCPECGREYYLTDGDHGDVFWLPKLRTTFRWDICPTLR